MLIFGHDAALARWAGDRLGIADFGPCVAIGVAYNNEIVAAAVYNQYRPPNIEITFVTSSSRWASPGAVRAILRYPFVQLKCKRVTAITHGKNKAARDFLIRLGFKQEGLHPDTFFDDAAVTYGLLAADAVRWIGAISR